MKRKQTKTKSELRARKKILLQIIKKVILNKTKETNDENGKI
jgi:hypothetical protein